VGGLVDDVVVDGGGGSGLEAAVVVEGMEDGGRNIIDDSVGLDRLQHQIKKHIYIYIYNIQRTRRCCKIESALSIISEKHTHSSPFLQTKE